MKKKVLCFIVAIGLLLIALPTLADVLKTQYSSTFRVSRGTLTGQERSYTNGANMGINCSDVSCVCPSGYYLTDTPSYKVTLYQGTSFMGTISNFPITSTTYCGRWPGAGPGTNNTLNYKFNFTPSKNQCENDSGDIKYGTVMGSCLMFSYD